MHGEQEGRFFHGFYGHYCYLPLYVFCGEFLLGATLHTADVAPGKRAVEELERIVSQIQARWPDVRIVVRGDDPRYRWHPCARRSLERVDFPVSDKARQARIRVTLR